MGKKKSVVLMTLITIVMLVLCAIVAFPRVTVPGSDGIKKWNPTVMQYDLGGEFSGGHYAYYYPNGVISEAEYENNVSALEGDELTDYQNAYKKHGGLYLSTDADDCIYTLDNQTDVSEGFKEAFDKSVELISARFAKRAQSTGSSYRVSVVDDYAIRVDISATENSKEMDSATYASQTFTQYANLGELSFEIAKSDSETGSTTTTLVDQLDPKKVEDPSVKKLIKSVSVKQQYKIAYLKITFTDLGKEMLKSFQDSEDATSLNLTLGDETLMQIEDSENFITSKNEIMYGVRYEEEVLYADILCTLINSSMEEGAVLINGNETTPFLLKAPTSSEIRTYAPVYGDTQVWVYVGVLAVLVLACVLAIIKMGGFGVMNAYTSLTYFVIAGFCFAFISGGVFAFTFSSVFVFLAGLALTNVLHVYIYNAIKAEAALGKTIQSSVKNGYKKTLWTIVDIYAVLLLGALALLVGVASLFTVACQAIICILAGAFCTLLWGRFINLMLVSASKDKYKHFRFVREDKDDEE